MKAEKASSRISLYSTEYKLGLEKKKDAPKRASYIWETISRETCHKQGERLSEQPRKPQKEEDSW